jgi:hypothetical protein
MSPQRAVDFATRSDAIRAYLESRSGRIITAKQLARSIATTSFSAKQVEELMRVELMQREKQMNQELPPDATVDQTLDRAFLLANHDEFATAKRVLADLPHRNPTAAILLARIMQDERNWSESTRWFQRALTMLDQVGYEDPAAVDLFCASSFGISENRVSTRDFHGAENVLKVGLRKTESMSGNAKIRFHFQLGRHYQMGGRPLDSMRHLEIAAKDPDFSKPAEILIKTIRTHTPFCIIRTRGP